MSKRGAAVQLTKDRDEEEEEVEEGGTWKKANEQVLAQRRKVRVRRDTSAAVEDKDDGKPTLSYPTFNFTPAPKAEEAAKEQEKKKEEVTGDSTGEQKATAEQTGKEAVEARKDAEESTKEAADKEISGEASKEKGTETKKEEEAKATSPSKPFNFATTFSFASVSTPSSSSPTTSVFAPTTSFNFSPSTSIFSSPLPSGSGTSFSPIFGENIVKPSTETTQKESKEEEEVVAPVNLSTEPQITGEEDEVHVFQNRAKLFVLDGTSKETNQWRERGVGQLRLNANKETGVSRLVMRVEGSLRLILNARLWPNMKAELAGDKGVRFNAPSVENPAQSCVYLVRLGRPEMAKELLNHIEAKKASGDKK